MKIFILLLAMIFAFSAKAQLCGTPSPTESDLVEMRKLEAMVNSSKARIAAGSTAWVPLKIHILQKTDGTYDTLINILAEDYHARHHRPGD